jgi:beta-xylosidase
VRWIDEWPVLGVDPNELGFGKMAWDLPKPVPSRTIKLPQGCDKFGSHQLSPFWAWNHQPLADNWSLTERPGFLRLHAYATANGNNEFFKVGNVINQRHMRSDSLSAMAPGQRACLANFNGGKNYSLIAVVADDSGGRRLIYEIYGNATQGPALPDGQTTLLLRSLCTFDDRQTYQYSLDGKTFQEIGGVYQPTTGNYRGNMIGLFTYNNERDAGCLDVDWFHYEVSNK